jgi:uncharacterized coiled-coil DUF342 family protein
VDAKTEELLASADETQYILERNCQYVAVALVEKLKTELHRLSQVVGVTTRQRDEMMKQYNEVCAKNKALNIDLTTLREQYGALVTKERDDAKRLCGK